MMHDAVLQDMFHVQGAPLRKARRPHHLLTVVWIVGIIELSLLSRVEPFLSPLNSRRHPALLLHGDPRRYHFNSRQKQHSSLGVVNKKRTLAENKNDFCVAIGKGAVINVDSLRFPHSLLVCGTVIANLLVCAGNADDDSTLVRVGQGGALHTDINGVKTVEAFGKVIGKVECDRLVVGPEGEILGDVVIGELSISPGGSIQGVVRCGERPAAEPPAPPVNSVTVPDEGVAETNNVQLTEATVPTRNGIQLGLDGSLAVDEVAETGAVEESEAEYLEAVDPSYIEQVEEVEAVQPSYIGEDIAEHMEATMIQEIPEGEHRLVHNDPGEKSHNGKVVSDKSFPRPSVRQNDLVDDFGNRLFQVPSESDVESLRRNREIVQQTRDLLESAKPKPKPLPGLPDWSAPINSHTDSVWDDDEEDPQGNDDETNLPGFLR